MTNTVDAGAGAPMTAARSSRAGSEPCATSSRSWTVAPGSVAALAATRPSPPGEPGDQGVEPGAQVLAARERVGELRAVERRAGEQGGEPLAGGLRDPRVGAVEPGHELARPERERVELSDRRLPRPEGDVRAQQRAGRVRRERDHERRPWLAAPPQRAGGDAGHGRAGRQ